MANAANLSHDAVADNPNHKVLGGSSSFTMSGDTSLRYLENHGSTVSRFTVSGAEAEVTWWLSGVDSDDFSISTGGILWFQSPPNYEAPTDADSDNLYRVRVHASDGDNESSLEVTAMVTNRWLDDDEVPVITGTAQVGQTLTADLSGIYNSDEDATYYYWWFRSDGTADTEIDGARSSNYTPTLADIGKFIKVSVYSWRWPPTLTGEMIGGEWTGENGLRSSAPTQAVAAAPGQQANSPATGQPTITGTAQVGEILAADTSNIADEDGLENVSYSYQWLSSRDMEIDGATGSAYTLADADEGKAIKVRVSFTDDRGHEESLTSAATDPVAAAGPTDPPPSPTNLEVSDNGDGTLTLTWDAPDDDSVTGYQVLRRRPHEGERTLLVYVEDTGSTATTWTDTDVTPGTRHTYRVKAINAAGLSGVSNYDGATPEAPAPQPEPVVNSPATGPPTISGTTQVGETLTADTSGIADEDGLTNATFSYQWAADSADISGATDSAYTLVDADVGKTISVTVSFTDDAGNEETLTSAATDAVAALQPDLGLGLVVIAASPWGTYPGDTFTISAGLRNEGDGVSPATTLRYYQSADPNIDTSDTEVGTDYVAELAASESTSGESVELTAPSTSGTYYYGACVDAVAGESDTSNNCSSSIEFVVLAPNTPATGLPTISGTPQVGETLTADTSGIADEDGLDDAVFSYQWQAGSADIAGATGSTYTLADADKGKAISVTVSFTDDAGFEESLTSAATAAVAAKPNSPATGQPAISGTPQVGQTLTADTSGIADEDGLTNAVYSYQWISNDGSNDADIAGATSSTYTPAESDEGKAIKVKVSFTDDRGHEESLTSDATTEVAARPNTPAAGAPTITGTAQAGETLTVSTSGITDEDGLANASFSYQWQAGDSDISGATSSTYTVADTDEGRGNQGEGVLHRRRGQR